MNYNKEFLQNIAKLTNDFIDEYNASQDASRKKLLNQQINKNIKFLKRFGQVK
jgi:hypothetical protein